MYLRGDKLNCKETFIVHKKKSETDYFHDNFEITYTEELPGISLDFEDEYEDSYPTSADDYKRVAGHPRRKESKTPDRSYRDKKSTDSRRYSSRNSASERTPASELASPLRTPMRAGTKLVEKIVSILLRLAPVVMSIFIILLTLFVIWTEHSAYGELSLITSEENLTLAFYLTVGAVILLWEIGSFFFVLGGVWTKTGRGITFFIMIYAGSYITSLFFGLIPEGIAILDGIRGGLQMYASLYPRLFTPCLLGIITCIFQKISK